MFCACVNYSRERKWVMRVGKAKRGREARSCQQWSRNCDLECDT